MNLFRALRLFREKRALAKQTRQVMKELDQLAEGESYVYPHPNNPWAKTRFTVRNGNWFIEQTFDDGKTWEQVIPLKLEVPANPPRVVDGIVVTNMSSDDFVNMVCDID